MPPRTAQPRPHRSGIPSWATGQTVGESHTGRYYSKVGPHPPAESKSLTAPQRRQSERVAAAISEYDSEIAREAQFRSVLSSVGSMAAASVGWYPGRHTRQR